MRKILEAEGVDYEAQVGIGRWVVDFVVGDRVIVEANGTYWHRKRPTVEARRIAKLQEMGYRVVVVTDRERDLRGALLGRLRDESASAPISA